MTFPRSFYIPAHAIKVCRPGVDAEAWVDLRGPRPRALGFRGKAQKPAFHYSFRSREALEACVVRFFDGVAKSEAFRAERKAASAAHRSRPHGLEVGTVLVSSWGYDQTNVDFYRVEALAGKTTVELVKLAAASCNASPEYGHGMAEHVTATDTPIGERFRKRATVDGVRLSSYASARVWDGKPRYCSWYA